MQSPWRVSPWYAEWVIWDEQKYLALAKQEDEARLMAAAPALRTVCEELLKKEKLSPQAKKMLEEVLELTQKVRE
jgi:hypothetical protein